MLSGFINARGLDFAPLQTTEPVAFLILKTRNERYE